MGWSNDQAQNIDGQSFTYTNTTVEYESGSSLNISDATLALSTATETLDDSEMDLINGSKIVVDSTSDIVVNGSSLPRGIVGRLFSASDLPASGTTATTSTTAAKVMQVDVPMTYNGRIYLIHAPALEARMNVAARAGVLITYTEDGSAPTASSTFLTTMTVNCPTVNSPVPVGLGCTYTRRVADGPLRVALWVWNVSGGGAVTISGGNPGFPYPFNNTIELLVIDQGVDPG